MNFIGITGGVGAGKSAILDYLSQKKNTRVMLADEIAHELREPGTACYQKLAKIFEHEDIFAEEGGFDRGKLAKVIFSDPQKRQKLNGIVHPAVKEYVLEQVAIEKNNHLSILVLEAALLIEEHYDTICDELWYIYTTRDNRRIRLKESRGYSDEKIDGIFASQLSEEEYRRACRVVIDNNSSLEKSYEQIEQALQIDKELKHE